MENYSDIIFDVIRNLSDNEVDRRALTQFTMLNGKYHAFFNFKYDRKRNVLKIKNLSIRNPGQYRLSFYIKDKYLFSFDISGKETDIPMSPKDFIMFKLLHGFIDIKVTEI